MAISPSEAAKKLLESNKEAIDREEQKIDMALAVGERRFNIPKLPISARTELVGRYQAAGWDLQEIVDQRDGNYWQFSERLQRDFER